MKIKNLIAVAGFAFFGGIFRYLFSLSLNEWGILIANLLGCFLLSFLTYYAIERDLLAGWLNLGLGTGLIGAFTTFSSFTTSVINLATSNFLIASGYFLVSLLGGFLAALIGYLLARLLVEMEGNR
ncbi:fluoride efflux transporter FluC [Limosilactobacillus fastidiosus]|uniref:Fluoride-specific ion channel FluC n=1 Tax=Limosilactobacillus fastidiosus TaxID=2759855 RepID=A0A7W3YCT0_9LACO|nr:CrcB family protein [Limosilactobacillus fastidiosus]MBB1063216.1 CrcB family protein [Limosilactobacillus fastidiosus]MBB1086312.1 CrcB family protein [Limosilactobacillus fastidiosus]MCD7083738.1 CrcB family protein [Limosilactobacillus fastidiosus]MCD7086417.1 CrcB family protein [Limosilactobacillus fastidiosus]MCD7114227.1 CrcB family protein [Limosilactobacillus fastidiosus]